MTAENEARRLFALRRYGILDTMAERTFDDIVHVAASVFDVPISLISLVDERRQWFKSKFGMTLPETPRDQAFCRFTMRQADVMVVEDATQDERFAHNPLVTGKPQIRFYAGAPLVSPDGMGLGALCIIDRKTRTLDHGQKRVLKALARSVMAMMELHRLSRDLARETRHVKMLSGLLPICSYCKNIRNDQGYWQRLEKYVEEHSLAKFSHSYCPTCVQTHFPDSPKSETPDEQLD